MPRSWEKSVNVGAGAKIFGDVSIGDGANIGANAVVLKDVPALSTAVGIPAKIINSDKFSKQDAQLQNRFSGKDSVNA